MKRFFTLNGRLHPVWRAAIYLALYLSGVIALSALGAAAWVVLQLLRGADVNALAAQATSATESLPVLLGSAALSLAWALAVAAVCLRWLDRAPFVSLGFQRARVVVESGIGLGVGALSVAAVFGVFLALGWVRVDGVIRPGAGAAALLGLGLILAAAGEEVVFRGYLLRTLLEWRGWPLAVGVSSLLFGLAHLGNPHITALALVNIALAGAAFALALKLTGRLWLPIAYHFAWNFTLGPVLGLSVSGLVFPALLRSALTGPALWTGGAFGPEGGLVVTLILLTTLGGLAARARRPGA